MVLNLGSCVFFGVTSRPVGTRRRLLGPTIAWIENAPNQSFSPACCWPLVPQLSIAPSYTILLSISTISTTSRTTPSSTRDSPGRLLLGPLTPAMHKIGIRLPGFPMRWIVNFYGLNPAGHHLTNLLFHVLNVVILFLLLLSATGAMGRSLLVAALFAVHPLNVESVAWVAERKNVLSTLFFLLALGAYGWYARSPNFKRYAALAVLFVLGLASKPMVITLPFVLLLLDFWPLKRMQGWGQPSVPGKRNRDEKARSATLASEARSLLHPEAIFAARSGKIASLGILCRQRCADHYCPAGRRHPVSGAVSALRPFGKRYLRLREIFVGSMLARAPCGLLSSPRRHAHWLEGWGGGGVSRGRERSGVEAAFCPPVSGDGLALVSRHAGARDWVGPSG